MDTLGKERCMSTLKRVQEKNDIRQRQAKADQTDLPQTDDGLTAVSASRQFRLYFYLRKLNIQGHGNLIKPCSCCF